MLLGVSTISAQTMDELKKQRDDKAAMLTYKVKQMHLQEKLLVLVIKS